VVRTALNRAKIAASRRLIVKPFIRMIQAISAWKASSGAATAAPTTAPAPTKARQRKRDEAIRPAAVGHRAARAGAVPHREVEPGDHGAADVFGPSEHHRDLLRAAAEQALGRRHRSGIADRDDACAADLAPRHRLELQQHGRIEAVAELRRRRARQEVDEQEVGLAREAAEKVVGGDRRCGEKDAAERRVLVGLLGERRGERVRRDDARLDQRLAEETPLRSRSVGRDRRGEGNGPQHVGTRIASDADLDSEGLRRA
jgi:hypothetical protein